MSEPVSNEGVSNAFVAALSGVVEEVSAIAEASAGYRTKCIEAGFNETAAEVMATEFHSGMLAMFFRLQAAS